MSAPLLVSEKPCTQVTAFRDFYDPVCYGVYPF